MNETVKALIERRSCRSFQKRQVEEEALKQILEAGIYAPTGMNRQETLFVVLQNEAEIRNLSRMNAAVMGASSDPFYGAPTVIVVLAERSATTPVQDGSAALLNLMNAASALGVGSCWINRAQQEFDSDEGRALLKKWGVEGDYVGVGHCILGYREGEKQAAAPRRENRIVRVP